MYANILDTCIIFLINDYLQIR